MNTCNAFYKSCWDYISQICMGRERKHFGKSESAFLALFVQRVASAILSVESGGGH